ncbi:MAG TPA: c-type cytochrome, partial [Candidatus Limnocylindria bacterium]|nr:c-type cytochrome [Candidatus Limnocylindria bacterium]
TLRFPAALGLWLGLALAPVAFAQIKDAATPVSALKVAKDFKVELLYTVPKANQGSWVSMCLDPKGRLIVSDQYGKLYRLTPPPLGSTAAPAVESIDVPIGMAQGLLYAFDSLYVMCANDRPYARGLYRVRDTDGDDKFDEVKLLRALDGGGEHGPHAIVASPDGKTITIISGDQCAVPAIDFSRVPLVWSEDHLLPRLWDGNGFMKGVLAPGGWVAKTDPEGKTWELVSTGFRNEYDAAYNRDGELFTFDADMEWDMNTAWYRPTRVNHVVSGSEFGWRSGAGKWPAYYADSLGAVVNIGPGSPTGVTFGYGTKFPAKYQEAFFINDWSYGKLYAVHLKPAGAGYTGELEEFIAGSPLPLTDLVVNPKDGALYFSVGGRKTQSALYRVTYVGSESTAPSPGMKGGEQARAERHKLESYHGAAVAHDGGRSVRKPDPAALKEAWPFLSSKDRNLRFAARIAVEWQPVELWREKALAEKNPEASMTVLMALARVSNNDQFHRKATDPQPDPRLSGQILAALDRIAWNRLSEEQQLELLRAYTLAFTRLGRPDEATRQKLIAKFDPQFPARSRELNAELAPMLVYLEAPSAATKLVAHLTKAPTQEEQLDIARSLRVLKTGWSLEQRQTYFSWFLKAASFRGGASLAGFLRDIKADAVATLSDSEKTALAAILNAKPVTKKPLENLLAGRTVVKEWTVNDLAPQLAKGLAKGRSFERGRELFGAVGCYNCHRFATEGGAVGPDLTGVAGRFSPKDLLESIIEPSKEVSDQYAPTVFTLKNGTTVIGRVANLNDDTINVSEDMSMPGDFTNVKRSELVSAEPSKTSPMPEGLLNTLKPDEILDLVAFLLSRGDAKAPSFK